MGKIWGSIKELIKRFYYPVVDPIVSPIVDPIAKRFYFPVVNRIPKKKLSFAVCLTEHCDLNCAGCVHFSPLAEQEFADYEETARDFARLSSLFHGHAKQIRFAGGEPLLHPDLVKFLGMARENFSDAEIIIITNGIRLLNQPEEFWQACKENKISIRPTKYPIPLDFEKMEKCAADNGVDYRYFNSSAVVKTLDHYRMDVKGLQDSSRNFLHCSRANGNCVNLLHGRLYTCQVPPPARHFNKYFGETFKELPEDSVDIYQANSAKEIMELLARPIPFCRYCMPDETIQGTPWHQSERTIEEWT